MKALLVYAHPEPRSFNASLKQVAIDTLEQQGFEVHVSDLYAMKFNPVAGHADFLQPLDPETLNISIEQRHGYKHGTLAADINQQLEYLLQAELLIFQFPLWWFGMPAILKGWVDRVLISGTVYGRTAQFDRGRLKNKRALACVTTGADQASFAADGINGDIHLLLMPLLRGVFGFTGMTVLPPFIGYSVPYISEQNRHQMMTDYSKYLAELDLLTPLEMPK